MSRRELRDRYRALSAEEWCKYASTRDWYDAARVAVPGGTPQVNYGRLITSTYPEMPLAVAQTASYYLALCVENPTMIWSDLDDWTFV